MCSPADDKYLKNGKCKICPPCFVGKGRNLTQAKLNRDSLDNTKCLPCKKCKRGTFNDGTNVSEECRPCTEHRCSNLNRNVQKQCSSTQDYICGACKFGYTDETFRDVKYPCYDEPTTKPLPRRLTTPGHMQEPVQHVALKAQNMPQNTSSSNSSVNPLALAGMCFGGILIIVVIFLAYQYKARNRRQSLHHKVEKGNYVPVSSSTVTSTGSECSSSLQAYEARVELETDGPMDTRIGDKLAHHNHVRGELASVSIQPSTVGGRPVDYPIDNSNKFQRDHWTFEKDCRCCEDQCNIYCTISAFDDDLVKKEDPRLQKIAYNICHNPKSLFWDLEIKDPEIYNLDDDRERFPDKVSQRDFIHTVLKRWVELQGREALYGKLRIALCKNRFHRVNEEVFG